MSWLSSFLGFDAKAPSRSPGLDNLARQFSDPTYGQQQLQQQTNATVQNALPSFLSNLQGLKEQNIRRGISTGDLGSSFEGDLTSAFQRNLANSVAGESMNLFNTRNNFLAGYYGDQLNREQAAQNDAAQRKSGFLGGLFGLAGDIFGGS